MLIAGSFTEYPLFLLIEIFRHRRETGLLEVSTSSEAGYFCFKNGEIKDGQFGNARGLEAIKLARDLEDASFNFKVLEPAEYARVVWERNFGGSKAGRQTNLHLSPSSLRQHLVHVSATYDSLESNAASLARQALIRAAAAYRNLEIFVISSVQRARPQAAAACSNLRKTAVSLAGHTHSYATATFNNLEKVAASTAGHTHTYALAAYSNLRNAVALTAERTQSYTAAAHEYSERAQAVRNRCSVWWQIAYAWQSSGRDRLKRLRSEVIDRFKPKLRLERALDLIKRGAAVFARLFEEPTRTRLVFGIITTSILIATLVTISRIGQRRDQSSLNPVDAIAGSNNDRTPSKKASGKRSHAPRGTGPALAKKVVANNEETRQQLRRERSSEGNRNAEVLQDSKPLGQEKEPSRVKASSERSDDSKASKTQPSSTPGGQTIPIVLQIENGRVSQASILKHRAGMEAYEAAALRIARARRYAGGEKRTETVVVKLNQRPD